ncbi:MAG: Uncharacterised protein [Prochlorococcus marinus str. MIT 9215]|nr:MAG: Uncharacterised protein [Prochlorococcus marinus str. MIT 9215]
MLITDAQQICEASVGEQQDRFTFPFKQGIGRHSGAQPHFINQPMGNGVLPINGQNLSNRLNSRVSRLVRLLGKHLANDALS